MAKISFGARTKDGVNISVDSFDPNLPGALESLIDQIKLEIEARKLEKNDTYYMWKAILAYVKGRNAFVDYTGIGFSDEEKNALNNFIIDLADDKKVYTTLKKETTAYINGLLTDPQYLEQKGYSNEFVNKLKNNVSSDAIINLVINQKRFNNFARKFIKKSESEEERKEKESGINSRYTFAIYQLGGLKGNYFGNRNHEAVVEKLKQEYESSTVLTEEVKSEYIKYCDELLQYLRIIKEDKNLVTSTKIDVNKGLDAEQIKVEKVDIEAYKRLYAEIEASKEQGQKVIVERIVDPQRKLVRIRTNGSSDSDKNTRIVELESEENVKAAIEYSESYKVEQETIEAQQEGQVATTGQSGNPDPNDTTDNEQKEQSENPQPEKAGEDGSTGQGGDSNPENPDNNMTNEQTEGQNPENLENTGEDGSTGQGENPNPENPDNNVTNNQPEGQEQKNPENTGEDGSTGQEENSKEPGQPMNPGIVAPPTVRSSPTVEDDTDLSRAKSEVSPEDNHQVETSITNVIGSPETPINGTEKEDNNVALSGSEGGYSSVTSNPQAVSGDSGALATGGDNKVNANPEAKTGDNAVNADQKTGDNTVKADPKAVSGDSGALAAGGDSKVNANPEAKTGDNTNKTDQKTGDNALNTDQKATGGESGSISAAEGGTSDVDANSKATSGDSGSISAANGEGGDSNVEAEQKAVSGDSTSSVTGGNNEVNANPEAKVQSSGNSSVQDVGKVEDVGNFRLKNFGNSHLRNVGNARSQSNPTININLPPQMGYTYGYPQQPVVTTTQGVPTQQTTVQSPQGFPSQQFIFGTPQGAQTQQPVNPPQNPPSDPNLIPMYIPNYGFVYVPRETLQTQEQIEQQTAGTSGQNRGNGENERQQTVSGFDPYDPDNSGSLRRETRQRNLGGNERTTGTGSQGTHETSGNRQRKPLNYNPLQFNEQAKPFVAPLDLSDDDFDDTMIRHMNRGSGRDTGTGGTGNDDGTTREQDSGSSLNNGTGFRLNNETGGTGNGNGGAGNGSTSETETNDYRFMFDSHRDVPDFKGQHSFDELKAYHDLLEPYVDSTTGEIKYRVNGKEYIARNDTEKTIIDFSECWGLLVGYEIPTLSEEENVGYKFLFNLVSREFEKSALTHAPVDFDLIKKGFETYYPGHPLYNEKSWEDVYNDIVANQSTLSRYFSTFITTRDPKYTEKEEYAFLRDYQKKREGNIQIDFEDSLKYSKIKNNKPFDYILSTQYNLFSHLHDLIEDELTGSEEYNDDLEQYIKHRRTLAKQLKDFDKENNYRDLIYTGNRTDLSMINSYLVDGRNPAITDGEILDYLEYVRLTETFPAASLTDEQINQLIKYETTNCYARAIHYIKLNQDFGVFKEDTLAAVRNLITQQIFSNSTLLSRPNDITRYLYLVVKNSDHGLSREELNLLAQFESRPEFSELTVAMERDYLKDSTYNHFRPTFNKVDYYDEMKELSKYNKKYGTYEGEVYKKRNNKKYIPRTTQEHGKIRLANLWFNNVSSEMDDSNVYLYELFNDFVNMCDGKGLDLEMFRRIVLKSGIDNPLEMVARITPIAHDLKDCIQDVQGLTKYEKENGRVHLDVKKMTGLFPADYTESEVTENDKFVSHMIASSFPNLLKKSPKAFHKFSLDASETLENVIYCIKDSVMNNKVIDLIELQCEACTSRKQKDLCKTLFKTPGHLSGLVGVVCDMYHLDVTKANVNDHEVSGLNIDARGRGQHL